MGTNVGLSTESAKHPGIIECPSQRGGTGTSERGHQRPRFRYSPASRNFVDDLKGKSSDLVRRLGMVGYITKGLAIAGAGVLVIVAAGRSEPNKATGLDGALKTLGAQPYGAALLIAAGLGIVAYGLYSFAMARYTKMLMSLRFSPRRIHPRT